MAFVAAAIWLRPRWMVKKQVSLPAGRVGVPQRWLSRCLSPQHMSSGSAAALTPRFVSHQGDRRCLQLPSGVVLLHPHHPGEHLDQQRIQVSPWARGGRPVAIWSSSARLGSWDALRSSVLPKRAAPSYSGCVANPGDELYGAGGAARAEAVWEGWKGPWVLPGPEALGPAPHRAVS